MKRGLILTVILSFAALFAYASVISLQTRIDTTMRQDDARVAVTLTNKGDESAFNVQVKTEAAGLSQESPVQAELPVGRSYTTTVDYPLDRLPMGSSPMIVRILYTDANRYPLSALALTILTRGKNTASDVLASLGRTSLEKHGRLTLKLKNLGDEPHPLHIRLATPEELTADPPETDLTLAAHQETSLTMPLHNFSALGGSAYPVYGILEYDDAGGHHTSLTSGMVRIEAAKLFDMQSYGIPIFAVLFTLFILINVRAYYRKRK